MICSHCGTRIPTSHLWPSLLTVAVVCLCLWCLGLTWLWERQDDRISRIQPGGNLIIQDGRFAVVHNEKRGVDVAIEKAKELDKEPPKKNEKKGEKK